MQESHREGVATHPDPESRVVAREGLVVTHPRLPGKYQVRILPEHGLGAISRTARLLRSTPALPTPTPDVLPEVEVRDLACYDQLAGGAL